MSDAKEAPSPATSAPQPVRRSRWQRFSPSMGWPAFWSEILIVVLGVVIALAASEAVEEWNWRNKVKEAEVRLQGDLRWVFLWAAEKAATRPCVEAQLALLRANIMASGDALAPVSVLTTGNIDYAVRMPDRPYRFPAWDALIADGTAVHFEPQRQELFGRISEAMARARISESEVRRLMGGLLVMRDPVPLDPGVRTELLTRISELGVLNAMEAMGARQRMRALADAGRAPADGVVEAFLGGAGTGLSAADFSGTAVYCRTKGLPLADWRDFRDLGTDVAPAAGAGATR